MATTTKTANPNPTDTTAHKAEVDAFLARFRFEEGALLVQVPQVPLDALDYKVARNRGYFSYPPSGLLYLSAAFEGLRLPTEVVDLNFEVLWEAQKEAPDPAAAWRARLDQALARFANPFICVSFMFDATYPQFREICRHIREAKPGACIAAGGVNATADPERLLAEGLADVVFLNEGEGTLSALYGYLRDRSGDLPINMVFQGSGGLIRTPLRKGGEVNLDIREQFRKIRIADYHKVGSLSNFSRMNGVDIPFATVLSRRGCRARCSFCSVRNFNGKAVRLRDMDDVVDEMEFLHREFGIRHFDWLDDDLLYDREETLKLFREMARRLPGITWAANNGLIAGAITPDLMDAMQASGCIGFKLGLESGNDEVLAKIHKPTGLKQFFAFSELAKRYPRLFVATNYILGFPGEKFGWMRDSLRVALRSRLDWNNFFMYQHLKNTELYIAFAGMSDQTVALSHGKESEGPNFNPVRGGAFKGWKEGRGILTGYDVADLDPLSVPSRDQLKEIWFTFNYFANFLRMPALTTPDETRLRNGLRWIEVLSHAYPEDAAMSAVAYFLSRRLGGFPAPELERRRQAAAARFAGSEYWRYRDGQFGFSALLEGSIPEPDARFMPLLEDWTPGAG